MAVAHVDGSSRGNPGPAKYAAVFHGALGELHSPIFVETHAYLTSNQAEYHAIILALEKALEHGAQTLHIYTDSLVTAKQLNRRYVVKAPTLVPLYERALELIVQLDLVVIQYVPREKNRVADRYTR